MTSLTRHDAAVVVEQALSAVFDPAVVVRLREDSPLTSAGMTPADAVCMADAVAVAAAGVGSVCALSDEDLVAVATVADLIDAVMRRSAEDGTDGGDA